MKQTTLVAKITLKQEGYIAIITSFLKRLLARYVLVLLSDSETPSLSWHQLLHPAKTRKVMRPEYISLLDFKKWRKKKKTMQTFGFFCKRVLSTGLAPELESWTPWKKALAQVHRRYCLEYTPLMFSLFMREWSYLFLLFLNCHIAFQPTRCRIIMTASTASLFHATCFCRPV